MRGDGSQRRGHLVYAERRGAPLDMAARGARCASCSCRCDSPLVRSYCRGWLCRVWRSGRR
eukprot:11996035-Alexandrium_andersonii.AAC.1